MDFVFYDTETTGTNTAFDQILQFGAIKTDSDLNEIDRFEIRSRLLPHVVPSPGAMRVTNVTVDQLTDPSLPSHYQMVIAIKEKITEWSPAIFIGHNSLNFDEHLLRQAFYKTLNSPYLTNTYGNCRTDSLRMIQAVARFMPESLVIPKSEKGKNVFKLDQLAPINGFDHRDAHDAMADVEATIHMCQLMAIKAPELWDHFIRFCQKKAVIDFAFEKDFFSLTDFFYTRPYSWFVTALGTHPENSSEILVFDLSNEPDQFVNMSNDELVHRLAKRPKPVRSLKANSCPIILSYEHTPQTISQSLPAHDELLIRSQQIKSDAELMNRLIESFLKTRDVKKPSMHIEEQIYDGFAPREDQALMDRFHKLSWPERLSVVHRLTDARLKSIGKRLIYQEAPDVLGEDECHKCDVDMAKKLVANDELVPWLTLPKAIEEVGDLLAVAEGKERALLLGLRDFLNQRIEEAISLLEEV